MVATILQFGICSLDPLAGLRPEKHAGTNLDDFSIAGRVAKVVGVPLDSLVIEMLEEVRIFDARGHVHRVAQSVVEPGRAGARGADSDNVGEPHRPYFIRITVQC